MKRFLSKKKDLLTTKEFCLFTDEVLKFGLSKISVSRAP